MQVIMIWIWSEVCVYKRKKQGFGGIEDYVFLDVKYVAYVKVKYDFVVVLFKYDFLNRI